MNKVAGVVSSVSEPAATAARPSPGQSAPTAPVATPIVRSPDLRLVIEEDPRTGVFVYKTMNRVTGEVVLQLPRADVLKTMAAGNFNPGDLFKTRV